MKNDMSHGFGTIDKYIGHKLAEYAKREKSFDTLFYFMFNESESVMTETSQGFRIIRTTYGEFKNTVIKIAPTVADALEGVEHNSIVGLYMSNCPEWLAIFWAILMCGYRPLLMNTRLPDEVLESIISEHSVSAVISDSKFFSVKTFRKEEVMVRSDKALSPRIFGNEVIFMSSGTTNHVKLCAYTGENFYWQICDSANIVKQCPDIKKDYNGFIKQLVLLPLYHVFGFIAVYLWFGFFGCTFVFPKSLDGATVQKTVKKHNVTHIFAVPMVWEAVHKAAMRKIKAEGEETCLKFVKVSSLVNKLGRAGDLLARTALRKVRDALFGDSVRFLVSGGSSISPEVLSFFNGIGYHMANGYGMTEIGITSVEKSSSRKILNSASIGAPFGNTFYSISDDGVLLVKGKTMASKIVQGKNEHITDFDEWFATNDIVKTDGKRYYVCGRVDDLIVGNDGENINPVLIEEHLRVPFVDRLCLVKTSGAGTVLLVSIEGCTSEDKIRSVHENVTNAVKRAKLESVISKILFTREPLLSDNEFKINRKKIAARLEKGRLGTFDVCEAEKIMEEILQGLEAEIASCIKEALSNDTVSVGREDNFFRDLGGSSIDYFSLIGIIRNKYGVDLLQKEGERPASVKDICFYLKNNGQ